MRYNSLIRAINYLEKRIKFFFIKIECFLSKFFKSKKIITTNDGAISLACILDKSLYNRLSYSANLTNISDIKSNEEIISFKFNALLFQLDKDRLIYFKKTYAFGAATKPLIENIISPFLSEKIPTIMWHTDEDLSIDEFISSAKYFDIIFTNNIDFLKKYKLQTDKKNSFLLPLAAQRKTHNPCTSKAHPLAIAIQFRKKTIYTSFSHKIIFYSFLFNIIKIFSSRNGGFAKFFSLKEGRVGEKIINELSTYDTLACGTPIICVGSARIPDKFIEVLVEAKTPESFIEYIGRFRRDILFHPEASLRNIRFIYPENTFDNRVNTISEKIGMPTLKRNHQKVSLVCSSKRPRFLKEISECMKNQTHIHREIIFITHSNAYVDDDIFSAFASEKELRIIHGNPDGLLADNLNSALDIATGDLFAKFDDDDIYGPSYLEDSIKCFEFSKEISIVGKNTYFTYVESADKTLCRFPGNYYKYTRHIAGATIIARRKNIESIKFERVRRGTDSLFIKKCLENGGKIFSSDPFNYLHIRYSDPNQHTWDIPDKDFIANMSLVSEGRIDHRIFL